MSDESQRADEAVTAEHLQDGSVRDRHGEVSQDPEQPGATAGHRRQVDAVEHNNRPAANETLGTTEPQHPRSRHEGHADEGEPER